MGSQEGEELFQCPKTDFFVPSSPTSIVYLYLLPRKTLDDIAGLDVLDTEKVPPLFVRSPMGRSREEELVQGLKITRDILFSPSVRSQKRLEKSATCP